MPDQPKARNDLNTPVTKLCRTLEAHRRTPEGAIRTSVEFLQHFFPHDEGKATDRVFLHLPHEVRGPILAAWGIRGTKSAVRDSDAKVESVVHDALLAGDLEHHAFEDGLSTDLLNEWVPLPHFWSFWRYGKQTKRSILRAFETAYELALIDAKWFLDNIESKGGKVRGTDVLSEGLTKADLSEWVRRIHQQGDGSPKGILETLGWEKLVNQTSNDALLVAMDRMAEKLGLVVAAVDVVSVAPGEDAQVAASVSPAVPTPPPSEPTVSRDVKLDPKAGSKESPKPPSKPPLGRKLRNSDMLPPEDDLDAILDARLSDAPKKGDDFSQTSEGLLDDPAIPIIEADEAEEGEQTATDALSSTSRSTGRGRRN